MPAKKKSQQGGGRIKNRRDLYDSEDNSDDEEFLSLKNKAKPKTDSTDTKDQKKTENKLETESETKQEEQIEIGSKEIECAKEEGTVEQVGTETKEDDIQVSTESEQCTDNKNSELATKEQELNTKPASSIQESDKKPAQKRRKLSADNKLLIESLDSMSKLSDMFSFCDSHLQLNDETSQSQNRISQNSNFKINQSELLSGLLDQSATFMNDDPWKFAHAHDIESFVKVTETHIQCAELNRIHESAIKMESEAKVGLMEKLTVPVETECSAMRTKALSTVQQR